MAKFYKDAGELGDAVRDLNGLTGAGVRLDRPGRPVPVTLPHV
jgi:hypothetical protein